VVGYKISNTFTILNIFLKKQERKDLSTKGHYYVKTLESFNNISSWWDSGLRDKNAMTIKYFFTWKKGLGYLNLAYSSGCMLEIKVLSVASQLCCGHVFGATSSQWCCGVYLPNFLKTIFLHIQISGREINHLMGIGSPEIQNNSIWKGLILMVAQLKMREGDFLQRKRILARN